HGQHSGKDFRVKGVIPEVIEVSFGVERLMLAVLEDAYQEEVVASSQLTREVLRLHPLLSPYFVAVIPLEKSLREKSYQLYCELLKNATFSVAYEETGNIGNRYRRQDAIGTYYCLTLDKQTLQDDTVTLRHRNSMKQELERIKWSFSEEYYEKELGKKLTSPTAKEVSKLIGGNRARIKAARRVLEDKSRGRKLSAEEKADVQAELDKVNYELDEKLQGIVIEELEKNNPDSFAALYSELYEQGKIATRLKSKTAVNRSHEQLMKQMQVQEE
ncbi:11356_t:CDS:2, partial [Ambispora leptoticha]